MSAPFFWLFAWGNLLLLLILFAIGARFACRRVVVQGESMLPTLVEGDCLLVLDWWPRGLWWKGQLVIVKSIQPGSREWQVKRIVARAGESISIPLAEISEREPLQPPGSYRDAQGLRTWQIPQRHVFVRGDNAARSIDSVLRGPYPYERIQGLVLMKVPRCGLRAGRREDVSAR